MSLTSDIVTEDVLMDLGLRYLGIGKDLDNDEREVLLFALWNENQHLGGKIYRKSWDKSWEAMRSKINAVKQE